MALNISEITPDEKQSWGTLFARHFKVDWDSNLASGGEALPAAFDNWLFNDPVSELIVEALPKDGYRFVWSASAEKLIPYFDGGAFTPSTGYVNDADTAASIGHPLYVVPVPGGAAPITLTAEGGTGEGVIDDDDNAASLGVQIYAVIDEEEYLPGYALGHLEFVSPTNAHGSCTISNGGPTLLLQDADLAATNGVAVRAIAADGGLEATFAGSGRTVLVGVSDGQFIPIADSTTGSTPNVYFDEDGANSYERLQAVVVDNMNETFELINIQADAAYRPAPAGGLRLATLFTTGPGAAYSKGNLGSAAGPEFTVTHDQAAAIIAGAAPLYVQAAGAGFNAAVPGGEDVFILLSNGEFLKVPYAASPAGVQVYWDHDGTNSYERMTAVVVDNADEPFSAASEISWRTGAVAAATDLSGLTDCIVRVIGKYPTPAS